ncbi:hypothetical protein M3Y94_00141900 [Aphelenchoides besseyi]|nr:hypothetical protein M3Y94_00141900 [Aphelenchoides besseyi]
MGREKSHEDETEIDCVDRGIHTFSQLNLNCTFFVRFFSSAVSVDNSKLTRLTLSHNKLSVVPPNISDLVNLEYLNLWNNQIEELPTTISALPNLKILNVGMNRLNKLPRGFGSFPKLEILDLTYNNLREQSLPGNFFFIQTLRALYLGDNDFESFPEDIGHMVNLQILVLRENDLIDLPKQLASLGETTRVAHSGKKSSIYFAKLWFQGNRLQVIPPDLGLLELVSAKKNSHKVLRVENNPWIGPLRDALYRDGVLGFWNYVRSDNYRRLYDGHPRGLGSPPPKRNKEKKISRLRSKNA